MTWPVAMDDRRATTPMRPWPWLFAVVYGLHLLDEGFVPPGLPRWSTEHGFYFTIQNWLSVSVVSFSLFSASVWLVARRTWPAWVLVALAVHITLHALAHIGASAWTLSISPGMLSGLILALPLAAWTFRWARHALQRRVLVRAAILGAASFQAPWDLLVRLLFGLRFWTA
jgi:hypothetical protein